MRKVVFGFVSRTNAVDCIMCLRSQLGAVLSGFIAALSWGPTSAVLSTPAAARDYSFHVLAHVPTRCSIHRAPLGIELVQDGTGSDDGHVLRGDGGFRVICNVPYAFDLHRVAPPRAHGKALPMAVLPAPSPAAEGADVARDFRDLAVKVSLPGREGPLEGMCLANELSAGAGACIPFSAPDDPRLGAPQAQVRLTLLAVADMSRVAREVVMSDAATAHEDQAAERPDRVSGLRIVLQPRH